MLEGRDLRLQPGDDLAAVEVLAAVAVAVDREQDLGLDLGEAVDDAAGAEVRRAARPDRADARRREEGDDRLGDVGQVGGDAVAGADAELAQPRGDGRDLGAQLAPAQLVELAQLRGVQDRDLVVVLAAEDVLGVVDRAPSNQRAPGIVRSASTAAWGVGESTSKKSQIEAQKSSGSVTDHSQSAA